jgi:hypothetical protein
MLLMRSAMRKCPKCSAVFDEHLNFCRTCDAMLETVVEELPQGGDSDKSDKRNENPKVAPRPSVKRTLSASKQSPSRLKELVRSAINELEDSILDAGNKRYGRSNPDDSLTLLNLHRYSKAPDRLPGECPKCGSRKKIPNLPVRCKSLDGEGNPSLYIDAVPGAAISEKHPDPLLLADVCGDCGNIELKVQNPQDLYNRYLQSEKRQ